MCWKRRWSGYGFQELVSISDCLCWELFYLWISMCFDRICYHSVSVLVYRPPKPDKDFTKEFSEFVSHIITSYDRLLILGDFNIHVCCPGKPMVAEFMHVLDYFGFTQHIENATHVLGHTLDLIMSYGFSIDNIIIEDACFSDHKPIVFNVTLSSFFWVI